ncbi:glycosyl hydrolase family 28-related protein [Sphingopyxis sp. SE2]|jgi:hypothetical protein|uniref:glycosyl hydrolase family 28-related protein n=1 Tax=unclassified Sphingopyxis TaxID=2614943 RepID=UPI00050E3727|nr:MULTISPECIES: glycosyl hydrolase family 28-related protein [unclassified Sphingopyxis]KGB53682.1 Pectate lyase superfamily protein [Sphingopyxis sp. LC363]MDT7527873.1 glycosyl hydrolase family 28-related protein [Sphingopyxis sp. SE2]
MDYREKSIGRRSLLAASGAWAMGGSAGDLGVVPLGTSAREIWITDAPFNADATGKADAAPAIQAALDAAKAAGGATVRLPAGTFRTLSTINVPAGIQLIGSGNFYVYDNGNVFRGSWLRYRGPASSPALRYRNTQKNRTASLGIDCGQDADSVGIWLGSDNAPACKDLVFEGITIFGAGIAVRWGDANAKAALEQVDSITFRDGACHSCRKGFVINATNAADYSKVERWGFDAMEEVTFDFQTFGFMLVENCAAGTEKAGHVMFKIASSSPDVLRIIGCQSEGVAGSKFLTYSATNDQGAIVLQANVVNQPIEVTGITKITSRDNYVNSTITLSGFVRWRSYFDHWDPSPEKKFVTTHAASSFRADVFNSAGQWFGYFLPKGWVIEDGQPHAGGVMGAVVVREGVKCASFNAGAFHATGEYFQPKVDNGFAYRVTSGGWAGPEPAWPKKVGAIVRTGSATFQNVGPCALIKGYGAIST